MINKALAALASILHAATPRSDSPVRAGLCG